MEGIKRKAREGKDKGEGIEIKEERRKGERKIGDEMFQVPG